MDIHLLDLMLGHLFAMGMDEKRQRKIDSANDYKQSCAEEITEIATELFVELEAVLKSQKPAFYPAAIIGGIPLLVLYSFAKVIKYQNSRLTAEQSNLINIYFQHFSLPFTKPEFIASATTINAARKKIVGSVGVSRKTIGDFWHALFKLTAVSKCGEDLLYRVIDKYMRMLKRFAALGGISEEAVQPICKQFAVDVLTHYTENRNPPEEKTDTYGEVPPAEHYKRMLDISIMLADKGNDEEFDEQFVLFSVVGLLYRLITMSKINAYEYADALDYAIKTADIEVRGMSGGDFIKSIIDEDGVGFYIKSMTYPSTEVFVKAIIVLGREADMIVKGAEFMKELSGFMQGIGTALSRKYANSGAMDVVRVYMTEILDEYTSFV